MRTRLIFNPAAGSNRRSPRFVRDLTEFVHRHAPALELVATRAPGEATELAAAAAAAGFATVAAVGGDGTANEVAQGVIGTTCSLALIPRGSGNGLARHVRIPLRADAALALLLRRDARRITVDTGVVNGRPFINAMGSGFDAEVAGRFAHSQRRGLLNYVRLAVDCLREVKSTVVEIESPTARTKLPLIMISVMNSPQYGNDAEPAPGARIDDGQLDLVAVSPVGAIGAVSLGLRLFRGNFDRHPAVRRLTGAEFFLRRPSAGLIHTDGEPHSEPADLRVTVRLRSLQLLLPP